MNNANGQPTTGGMKITPGDIIYTIFRHLKKIVFFIVIGLGVGAAVYVLWPDTYVSQAQLLVKYVTENREVVSEDGSTRTLSPGGRSSLVMQTELAILRSMDLAIEVDQNATALKETLDPENKLAVITPGTVRGGLTAASGRGSNIISLTFSHKDRALSKPLLDQIIQTYLDRHFHIHQDRGTFDDFLTQQTDQAKARLMQTEEELINERRKAGLISIEQARSNLVAEISRIRQSVNINKADLAEAESIYKQFTGRFEELTKANENAESQEEAGPSLPEEEMILAVRDYERKRTQLEILKSREKSLLTRFTPESSRYKAVIAQIAQTENEINALTTQYPSLFTRNTIEDSIATTNPEEAAQQARLQLTRINSIKSRLNQLDVQMGELQAEASRIDQVELTIKDLTRRKNLEESNYRTLLANLEKNRLSDAQSAGRVSNITILQSPTSPSVAQSVKAKFAGGFAGGICAIGLLWAFLVDIVFDRSIKRPTEIQRNLGIPLFMSLPDLNSKRFKKIKGKASRHMLQQAGRIKQEESKDPKGDFKPTSPTLQAAALSKPTEYGITQSPAKGATAPWDSNHALSEHFEGLRDKVITYFESKNLTHKPKLIGMTGLGQGSGVTTIASGLASSLSNIGEGNVLLVDMTLGHETAQQFYKGKNILNLDEVLESSDDAKMENNLYVVAEGTNGTKLPRIMPQRFNKIMPKLRASDFDYIVFDMPPVSPISSTPRLASFMDIVLMVMESEETNRDVANQALEILTDSKAHLGGILNKTKSRVPRKLEKDLLSQS
ncbi:Chain length determinant protein [Verrucomicrobiia bacterium DG1235]|nr:Chain length determinant protein [Verrucomicrobiae bacterium DG1235]